MNKQHILMSAALGGLLMTAGLAKAEGTSAPATAPAAKADYKCEGANACKGKGECAGKGHECGGHNECKGKGLVKTKDKAACDKMMAGMAKKP